MSAVNKILECEIGLISRFIALLEEEQHCLKQADPAGLPHIDAEKSALVDQLNALEKQRIKLIGGLSSLSDRERMHAWLSAHPSEQSIANNWQNLIELAQSAKRHNEMNASLVRLHLEKTAQALAILTSHSQKNMLYDSCGQSATYTGSRIVDSA